MASLLQTLTLESTSESAGFLNTIIAQLWPNINVAGCKMVKEVVEPMLATMLPGPLTRLRFSKLDLGNVPLQISKVDVGKTEFNGIKLDLDLDWSAANCDIELSGHMVPTLGVKGVQLHGRLSVLLCPLTNEMPLIGAAQIAFINPPTLNLEFVGAADVADFFVVKKMVHKVILDVIASMLVLPNRLLVKLDAANDYFRTYQHHLGVLRLSVVQATGIKGDRKGGLGHLLDKVMKDIPDCYCRVNVGAEKDVWQTKTLMNTRDPAWNETHDFLVMDHDQYIGVEVLDKDFAGDDNIGVAMTPVRQLLLAAGGTEELALAHDGKPTDVKLKLSAKWYEFVPTTASLSSSPAALEEDKAISGRIAGLVTVLVASVHGLKGDRAELHPSVKVNWGAKHEFRTAVQSYSQGVDIFNPSFDTAFRIPITAADLASPASFRLTLMNRDVETGSIEVTFADMLSAPGMTKEDTFAVGTGGSTVRASIWLRGTELAK